MAELIGIEPYEIVAPLGAGGMGQVWRARDTRLDRSVAIKVLPADYAQNAQLRLRLDREAKTISQLNHPNICTLHDVGNESGTTYLVMELVEGESIADRLDRGPLPIRDVLRFGAQMADALDRDGVNLTNEKIIQYDTDRFRPRAVYDNGRYYFVGVRFQP